MVVKNDTKSDNHARVLESDKMFRLIYLYFDSQSPNAQMLSLFTISSQSLAEHI